MQISSYFISTDDDENGVDSFGFPRHGRAKSVIGVNNTSGECFVCYVKLRSVIVTYSYKKLIYIGMIFLKNFPLSLLTFATLATLFFTFFFWVYVSILSNCGLKLELTP